MIATFTLTNRSAGMRTPVRGQTETEREPIVRVQYSDSDPVRLINMIEETLGVIKARYLSQQDRPAPPDEDEEDDDV